MHANIFKHFRTECYNYPEKKVWSINNPLIREEDYQEWEPKFLVKHASTTAPYG